MTAGVIIVLVLALFAFLGIFAFAQQGDGSDSGGGTRVDVHGTIQGNGDFGVDVVGESHYLANLRAIVGGTQDRVRHECDAVLYLENDNEHDRNAVRVFIAGKTVGYLSRDNARDYRADLKRQGHDAVNLQCRAVIIGGGPHRKNLGVWLDILPGKKRATPP